MKIARRFGGTAAVCAFVAGAFVYAGLPARSFDLQDSPVTVKRPAADITDTYFFPSPTNSNNVVAVMDVYPLIPASAGAATALTTFFDQGVLYTMKFDNRYSAEASNARPLENLVIQFSFGAPSNGTQQVFVYGPSAPNQTGPSTTLVNGGFANGAGFINKAFFSSNSISYFAGARRDPAFFDVTQFLSIFPDRNKGSTAPTCLPNGTNTCPNGFTTGNDFFAQSNVLSIVAEIPKSLLTGGNNGVVAYWATTATGNGQ